MMKLFPRRSEPSADTPVPKSTLAKLDEDFISAADEILSQLRRKKSSTEQGSACYADFLRIASARAQIAPFLHNPTAHHAAVLEQLHQIAQKLVLTLGKRGLAHHQERMVLAKVLAAVISAEHEFARTWSPPAVSSRQKIIIPTELLHQAYSLLFPPERMLVAAGRREGNVIRVTTLFDVTGKSSAGHVLSDPELLAKSLILMSATGAFLILWIHSHPGTGIEATHPSGIDLTQHNEWIRCYSPALLSLIAVRDGWLRFWGTGLDQGRVEFELIGQGIKKKENSRGRIYRLCD